jgi:tetratricopeptide (TPR) repeat protein
MKAGRLRLTVAAAVFLACWGAYLATLNPAYRADDSPETAAAAATLGIQHPPGYPLHTLLGRCVSLLPLGSPAWRLNLFAAMCGALAAALLCLLVTDLAADIMGASDGRGSPPELAGAVAGLAWGFSATFWSQSLAAKGGIYTFQMALFAGMLSALFAWGRRVRAAAAEVPFSTFLRLSSARAFVGLLALGMCNHWETQALILPPAVGYVAWVLWPRRKSLGSWRNAGQTLVPLTGIAALGLSPLLYLPIRARLEPALNWGAPATWDQFWWVLQRQEYLNLETGFLRSLRSALFSGGSWTEVATAFGVVQRQAFRVGAHLFSWKADLGWGFALLGIPGCLVLKPWARGRGRSGAGEGLFLASLVAAFVGGIIFWFHLPEEKIWILDVFLLPAYLVQAVTAGLGVLWLTTLLPEPKRRIAAWFALACLPFLAGGLYLHRSASLTQRRQFLAWDFAHDYLLSAKKGAILLSEGDFFTMPVFYAQSVDHERPDVDLVTSIFLSSDWGVAHVKARQPSLGLGDLPHADMGERTGDGRVLRAAVSQMYQAHAKDRPFQASLYREVLDRIIPEWKDRWRPMGLASCLDSPPTLEEDRRRLGLLKAFRTRHWELDRSTLDPSPTFALSNYGEAFLAQAAYERAAGRAAAALPLYAQAALWTSRSNLANVQLTWAVAEATGGRDAPPNLAAAERHFRESIASGPSADAWWGLAKVENERARAEKDSRRYADALDSCGEALHWNDRNPAIWVERAIALQGLGRSADALESLRQAAALDPSNPDIQNGIRSLSAQRSHP